MNVQSLAVLLRALRQGEPSPRATSTARPVSSVVPVIALASEDGSAPALRRATEHLPRMDDHAGSAAQSARAPGADGSDATHRASTRAVTSTAPASFDVLRTAPPGGSGAASVALSSGAAFVSEALRSATTEPVVPVVRARQALVASPDDPMELAHALHESLTTSGLFYESHVARWAQNRYPTVDLQREPQAAWTPAAGDAASPSGTPEPWHDNAAPMVRQQLDMLELGRVLWHGEMWPGQHGQIEFVDPRHVDERGALTGDEPRTSFRTRVSVELPKLGRVIAVLGIDGELVTCRITAAKPSAVERLAAASPALADAMDARKLLLASCAVDHEPAR